MARALNNNLSGLEEEEEDNAGYSLEKYEFLMGIFPDANPIYLRDKCKEYYDDEYGFQRFIRKCLKNKQYPRKADYERQLANSKERKFYTSKFSIEEFLKHIPNPEEYFSEKNKTRMNQLKHLSSGEKEYAETFLKNYFRNLYVKTIKAGFQNNSYDLVRTVEYLKLKDDELKKRRSKCIISFEEDIHIYNLLLLQEIAYLQRRDDILSYIENKEIERQRAINEAKNKNLLNTCECCFDDEVLLEETISCNNGHNFCLICTKKGCEVMLEQGKQEFPCFANCDNFFNIYQLEGVLRPKVFANILKANQLKEIKAASLEDLECCPHCDFAAIMSPAIKVFSCLNSDCLKETCRLCRQPSHVPLRCDEVEVAEEVKIRTLLEDKMTEALVRTCYKCNMKFLKEDGCNKMTCQCGAMMCYVCKQPVTDYSHFNGPGGDKYDLCPLFSDTDKLHAKNVLEEAKKLRKTIHMKGEIKLKVDPTEDIEYYYEKKKKRSSCCKKCNCRRLSN